MKRSTAIVLATALLSLPQDSLAAWPPINVCVVPLGIPRVAPSAGYWANARDINGRPDACAYQCLPPRQIFSICTQKYGKLFFDPNLLVTVAYGATWEVYTTGCPSWPWRVWQLTRTFIGDGDVGAWSSTSMSGSCEALPKTGTAKLTLERIYYTATEIHQPTF